MILVGRRIDTILRARDEWGPKASTSVFSKGRRIAGKCRRGGSKDRRLRRTIEGFRSFAKGVEDNRGLTMMAITRTKTKTKDEDYNDDDG